MKVFKFGGASVKDAQAVKNVVEIIQLYTSDLLVVISAMGKTTNSFEEVINAYFNGDDYQSKVSEIYNFHQAIIKDLGLENDEAFLSLYRKFWEKLNAKLAEEPSSNYDFEYDQIVSYGELFSTIVVSGYMNLQNIPNEWIDARKIVRTDNNFRSGTVDWELTEALFKSKTGVIYQDNNQRNICITQGFIGHTDTGLTTTLGREGSDFSAGIAAYCLDAEDVTIWKDVPGMLNADPKFFNNTEKLEKISFREAIELSYYGASVIHPKTIKPLQNKNIPLYVKSFMNPKDSGTTIQSNAAFDSLIPSFIFKEDQTLISITPRDFSFITEANMSEIFNAFDRIKLQVNLMQNSALNFSICIDSNDQKVDQLMDQIGDKFAVKYNTNLELLTIRHHTDAVIKTLTGQKEILAEQRTRQTARFVMR